MLKVKTNRIGRRTRTNQRARRKPACRKQVCAQRPLVDGFGCCGSHADEASTAAAVFKLDVPGDQREERVVLALADVFAGLVFGAALANQNRACVDQLAAEALYSQPLAV